MREAGKRALGLRLFDVQIESLGKTKTREIDSDTYRLKTKPRRLSSALVEDSDDSPSQGAM